MMASISQRANGIWRVRWREVPGGPQSAKHFDRKRDALRFKTNTESDLLRGVYVDPVLGQVSLVKAMTDFVDRQPWRHNTLVNARNAIEHVRGYFGDGPISAIRTGDLQGFVTSLDLEPRTVQTIFQFVRHTIREAHLDGVIGRDPSTRVRLPQYAGEPLRVPTVEEVMALRQAAPDDFAVAVVLAAGLGLRASEVAGLSVDRVDFLRREVLIDRQWHGKLDRFEPPKSKASHRTVPVADSVLEELAEHVRVHGVGEHGILVHANGRPLNSNRMDWRWELTVRPTESSVTMHDLRHHYASSLISAGCSIVAVQRALGHAKPSTTLDTYGHLMPSDQDRIRGAVDEAWKAAGDSLGTEQQRKGL